MKQISFSLDGFWVDGAVLVFGVFISLGFSVASERETPFLPRRAKACQYFFEIFVKKFGLPGFTVS